MRSIFLILCLMKLFSALLFCALRSGAYVLRDSSRRIGAVSYETLFCTAILRSPALTSYETLLGVVCCVLRKLFFGTGMFALSGAYVLQDSSRRILLCLRSPALAIALTGNVQG